MTQVSNISQPESIPVNRYYSQQASSLVIIDASVDNLEILKAGLKPGAEVVVLHPQLNGIEQITTLVSRRKNLQKVHLVSHGSAGSIKLGACELNSNNIKDYSTQIQSWFGNLGDRSLYIYGCQVALGNEGQSFVRELHNLTGAGIAAATKKVGSSEDGGVWLLDYKVGNIDSEIVFTDEVVRTYLGTFMEEDGEVVPESELIVAESLTEEPLGENLLAEVAPEAETASDESVIELIEADSAAEELFAEIADAEAARDIEASDELEVPIDVETAIELEEIASESDVVEPVVAGVPGAEVPIDVETAIELEEIASESDVVEPVVAGDPLAEDSIELETAIDETVIEPTVEEFVVTGDPLAEDSIELETAIEETVIEPTVEEFVVTGDPLAEDSIEVETAIDEVVEADSIEEDTELNEPAVVEPGVVASIPEGEAPIEIETAIEESVVEPFTEEDSAIEQAVAGVPFGEAVEIETAIEQPVIEPAVVEPAVVEEIAGIPVVVEPAVVEDSFIEPLVVDAPEVAANDLIDLSAVAQGDTVLTEFSVTREAGFNNTVDFYEVNADGSVVDPESGETIAVGEAGYTEAALTNRIGLELATENGEISKFSAELEGGNFYAPILAVETGFDALSDSDPNNDPTVYFTYSDANNDGFDHVINSAPNVFEFEDIANGGDQDFNDLIVAASFGDTSAEQVPAVAPLVNEPAIEPLVEPPVVELPVGAPEVLDEPVVEEPAVVPPINQPVIEEPPFDAPEVLDEPVVEEPAVVPPINQPVIEEPPVGAPEAIDEPVVEEPAVVPPVVEPPVVEPETLDEPAIEPTDESVSEVPIEESSTTNTIDGVEIQLGQFAPNLETPVTEPLTAVIGDDVEFSFGETESDDITGEPTSSQIDIISGAPGQASIVYQIGSSQPEDTFDAAEFNGLVFGDSSGDLPPIENVTLNESVTTIGLDSSDVIFSEDLIAINFESVTLEPGLTARFDIDFADA